MKLTQINLIILYQIIEFWVIIQSDHVQVMRCSKEPQCLQNLDEQLLEVIKDNMENTTQPCEHFWNYACGSWTSAPYYDHMDNFGAMANYYADNLIKTLQELHTADLEIQDLVDQLMKYFISCKSIGSYHLNMPLYLKELPVQKIFGESFNWDQLFQQDNWQNFNWLKAVAHLRKYGLKELFLQESVQFAWNNSQQNVVQIKIPHAKTNFVNKYKVLQIMIEFDLIVGYKNTKNYLKLSHELVEFDKRIMELNKNNESKTKDHLISLQELSHLVNNIDWYSYFELLLGQVPSPRITIEISGNLKYFQDLDILLQQTPKNVQASYILIRFCQYLMDIRPLISDRECLLHTNLMFPVGVNYIYNRFLYKTRLEDEEILQRIFALLKHEFSKNIQANKFSLTLQELEYLKDKLNLMRLKIGNLPLHLHDINHYYSMVQLDEHNFYHNHLEMLKFRTWQQHQLLAGSTLGPLNLNTDYINDDITQLRTAPYFIHQRNMLIVPMIFLQLPFYHYAQHPVLQISLVGWVIAHELSHAFDTRGLRFDAWGNENLLGIKLSRKAPYRSAVECLVKHTAAVSLNERMADVNGLQLAWQVFAQQILKNHEYYELFSLGKLFFINFAQFFCGSLPRPIGHDRDDIRVRQSVANMREFAKVFQCSRVAKENPAEKCNIWRIEI